MDLQILLNYITIFIIPAIIGSVFSIIFSKSKKVWLISVIFAIASGILFILNIILPSNGNEAMGLLTLSALTAMVSSIVCCVIINLIRKKKKQ